MKTILGISAFYHDSAAALIVDGKIVAAAQEERFTRIKNSAKFPVNAIRYCLEEGGLEINELDAVVFYDKPLLKFERLLQTYYSFAPKGLLSFLKSIPVWLNEKLFLKNMLYKGLKEVGEYDKKELRLLFSGHHLSHAASAFYPSPFLKSAILTIDGVGEWCTASISIGDNGNIEILKEMEFPHSVGLLYSAFTYYLGFTVNSGEYKLMGLAPFGNKSSKETLNYISIIKNELIDIKDDGSIWLNQSYFSYATSLRMIKEKKWKTLFGLSRRQESEEITQEHCNLALAIQTILEEILLKMAIEAKKITGADYLCMAGGVALNCVANGKLHNKKIFKDIYIQPASGDSGGAIGSALAVYHMYFNCDRKVIQGHDQMSGTYLGPDYSEKEIVSMNKKTKAVYTKHDDFSELIGLMAKRIANGNVIGWFQGRMEFGPRALGNRSILADARNPEMQKIINSKIKYREGFRPFAPSVLEEDVAEYFDSNSPSPYMLFTSTIKKSRRNLLPDNYCNLLFWDKLYYKRSDLPSITHLDFSARFQTVNRETNSKYWLLINAFKSITGYSVILNTSFNVRGKPIVATPHDAYQCFMNTEMDYLVIGDFVYSKISQPDWIDKEKWKIEYQPD